MYFEPDTPHNRPHFHAYYQNEAIVIAIDDIEILAGTFPQRQLRFVEAWAEIHKNELVEDWNRLQNGRAPLKIEPLH